MKLRCKIVKTFIVFIIVSFIFLAVGCQSGLYGWVKLSYVSESYKVSVGESVRVNPLVRTGKNVNYTDVILFYQSDDESIALYNNGVVTGLKKGETTIRVVYKFDGDVKAETKIIVYEPNYFIKYEIYGGVNSPDNPTIYQNGTDILPLENPTFEGYNFLGWYDNVNYQGEKITSIDTNRRGSFTLYAKWDKINIITYNLNGGVNNSKNPSTYTANTLPITLFTPTRYSYIFKGWFDNENFEGEAITIIEVTEDGNKTFYAKWEKEIAS